MKEIPWDIRERAEDLYIVDGHTYDQVAEETGVSVSQLKRWGQDFGWREKRLEYRKALSSIRRDRTLLRAGLMKKALETLDPQAVYAVSALESVIARMKDAPPAATDTYDEPTEKRIIKTPQDAISAMEEAAELKINKVLSRPESMDLKAAKNMKEMLTLIGKMKEKYIPKQEKTSDGSIDKETIERIMEQLNF